MPTCKEMRWVLFNFLSEVVLPLATMYWQLQTLLCFGRCFLSTTPSIIIWEGVGGRCQTVAMHIWVPWAKKHRSHLAAMALETADHRSYPVNDGSRQGIVRESSPNGNNSGLCFLCWCLSHLDTSGAIAIWLSLPKALPTWGSWEERKCPKRMGWRGRKNQLHKRCHSCLEYFGSDFQVKTLSECFRLHDLHVWFTCRPFEIQGIHWAKYLPWFQCVILMSGSPMEKDNAFLCGMI